MLYSFVASQRTFPAISYNLSTESVAVCTSLRLSTSKYLNNIKIFGEKNTTAYLLFDDCLRCCYSNGQSPGV